MPWPDLPLQRALPWVLAALAAQVLLLLLACAWVQVRWERRNRLRAAQHARWEQALFRYLYDVPGDLSGFGPVRARQRPLIIPFLLRVLATYGGQEGAEVRALYYRLRLYKGLGARLRSRRPKLRALAALEAGTFRVVGYSRSLQDLLEDPEFFVARVAAQGLADTRDLAFAEPVFTWVVGQERIQPGRQLELLERFGPGLMRWLEARLDAHERHNFKEWIIYARLAASGRRVQDPSLLLAMLDMTDIEALTAAIRALGSLGIASTAPFVRAFADHAAWEVRALAATAIGSLSGPPAIPVLVGLMSDPVFVVRRNAAQALARLGPEGLARLEALAADAGANPFARALAGECLQWQEGDGA